MTGAAAFAFMLRRRLPRLLLILLLLLPALLLMVSPMLPPVPVMAASSAGGETTPPVGPIDYAAARARLRDVLARREFKNQEQTRWADVVRQRVEDWFRSLFSRLGGRGPSAATVGRVLAWVVAIGVLLIAAFWLSRAWWRRDDVRSPIVAGVQRLSSREWAARAGTALAAGDAKEALRCAYHAVLFRLEEQGVWHVDDSRTPREYVTLFRDTARDNATTRATDAAVGTASRQREARGAAFADLTRDFELSWYGSQAVRVDDLPARLEVWGCPVPSERTR